MKYFIMQKRKYYFGPGVPKMKKKRRGGGVMR
jgi:hypothetical protein